MSAYLADCIHLTVDHVVRRARDWPWPRQSWYDGKTFVSCPPPRISHDGWHILVIYPAPLDLGREQIVRVDPLHIILNDTPERRFELILAVWYRIAPAGIILEAA